MTDNEIIGALDGADVFLRNRTNSEPAPLNEYDIEALIDIAKVCDEAANLIIRQKAEIEALKKDKENFAYSLANAVGRNLTVKEEVVKEFAERLKAKKHECGCNFRKKPVFAVTEEKINETYKEMGGEG